MKREKTLKVPESIEDFSMRELGAIFRRERERRGLSQGEVAKRIGKSKTAVVYYEMGLRPIHWGRFVKLCSAIRVSPQYIIERWMSRDTFDVLDEERRKEYHTTLDQAIKFGFSAQIDWFFIYIRALITREKEIRERIRQREMLHRLSVERGEQGENGV